MTSHSTESLSPVTAEGGSALPWTGLLSLFTVYIFWGSTFLAIRLTVREGSGFPPLMVVASRTLVAGAVLLGWAALRRELRISRRDLLRLAISGIGLWVGGNTLVTWAEQRIASGFAALIIASTPMWVAVVEAILDKRLPSRLLVGSLLVGFGGIGVLTFPTLETSTSADILSLAALLLGAAAWAIAVVYQRRNPVKSGARTSSGYQQLSAGIALLVIVILAGVPRPTPTREAWLAWGYLVIFGSLVGYTALVMALKLLPANVVVTNAFVNPVIAVALGWLVLREPITVWTLTGAALVMVAVAGVFRDRALRAEPLST